MSNKIKCDSALIDSFKKAISEATKEVTNSQAALAEAKRDIEIANEDDGKIGAEELYARIEQARKNVFLRKTEAKRASAKLEEIEAEFMSILQRDARPILSALETKVSEATSALRVQLLPLVSKGDSYAHAAVDVFIRECDEVKTRIHAIKRLRFTIDSRQGREILIQDVAAAVQLI